MENIIILGSTGSIGTQALNIIKELGGYNVLALCCGHNVDLLRKQIIEFNPKYVYTVDENKDLIKEFPSIEFFSGKGGILDILSKDEPGCVLNALSGIAGIEPTIVSIINNRKVLLSNKESLVCAGDLVYKYLEQYDGTLYPIDSEHSSLWELLESVPREAIKKIYVTASGGPFRDLKKKDLKHVSPKDALSHPNWNMGSKITIDSATLMNKGFEIIEAHYLFNFPLDMIGAFVNRESIIHAATMTKDSTIFLGMDNASMRNPIIRALYYPCIKYERYTVNPYDLSIEKIRYKDFKCFGLPIRAFNAYPLSMVVLEAADEAAISLFIDGTINFNDIYKICNSMVKKFKSKDILSIENIYKYDKIVKDTIFSLYRK